MPKLTEDFIRNRAKPSQGKDTYFRDESTIGFQLRIRRMADKSLQRSFFFEYQIPGTTKRRKLSIGPYPTFDVDQARERASAMARDLKEGRDPADVRAEAIAAELAKPTLEQAWQVFEEEHLALKSENTLKDYRGRYRRMILPTFKGRKIETITRAEVNKMRLTFKDKPLDLNRALAVLSKFFSFAMIKEWVLSNPVLKVERFEEVVNETWLDENQLPKFVEELVKHDGAMPDLIRFVTLTGWRITSARLLRWEQVDLSRLSVNLKDTATKKNATALSAEAAAIIDSQSHRKGYVFSEEKGKEPCRYKSVLALLADISTSAGLPKITPHWLRRTLATHAAIGGANVAELMQTYGWRSHIMAMRYVKRSESLARQGVERAASIVNLNRKPSAETVKIG